MEEANALFLPLMDSLARVHEKGVIHRDISPDNIIITQKGTAKLIDFGAARYSTGEMSKSFDVILKHGFAPKEQYIRRSRQGPFTDVYALAATYYFAITGKVPPDALERMDEDPLILPSKLGVKIDRKTEAALLKALSFDYKDRYQNMAEFRDALIGTGGKQREKSINSQKSEIKHEASTQVKENAKLTEAKSSAYKKSGFPTWLKIAIPVLLVVVMLLVVFTTRGGPKSPSVTGEPEMVEPSPEVEESAESEAPVEEETTPEEASPVASFLDSEEGIAAAKNVGSLVALGSYEQDNDLSNGTEPIEWIVLDVQDGRSLLISRFLLDRVQYDSTQSATTWEHSTLRGWLNNTFLNEAFSEEERTSILTVTVPPDKNPDYDISAGNSTQDQIFILSMSEAEKYFASDEARAAQTTAYAAAQEGIARWWLRSPGFEADCAAEVSTAGSINSSGNRLYYGLNTIRPAMWVDLGS